MATQGLITVKSGWKVLMKIVAGCDGDNAQKVADQLQKNWPVSVEDAYKIALEAGFGDVRCLVVITDSELKFEGEDDGEFSVRYRNTFQRPEFNPRWDLGTADHVVVVDVLKEGKMLVAVGERAEELKKLAAALNRVVPKGEAITQDMVDAATKNMERVAEMVKSPEGKCKVIGVDKFSYEDWVEAECGTSKEAIELAEKLTTEAKENASDESIATVFYAYDPDGNYIGGDTWESGERGGLAK